MMGPKKQTYRASSSSDSHGRFERFEFALEHYVMTRDPIVTIYYLVLAAELEEDTRAMVLLGAIFGPDLEPDELQSNSPKNLWNNATKEWGNLLNKATFIKEELERMMVTVLENGEEKQIKEMFQRDYRHWTTVYWYNKAGYLDPLPAENQPPKYIPKNPKNKRWDLYLWSDEAFIYMMTFCACQNPPDAWACLRLALIFAQIDTAVDLGFYVDEADFWFRRFKGYLDRAYPDRGERQQWMASELTPDERSDVLNLTALLKDSFPKYRIKKDEEDSVAALMSLETEK